MAKEHYRKVGSMGNETVDNARSSRKLNLAGRELQQEWKLERRRDTLGGKKPHE